MRCTRTVLPGLMLFMSWGVMRTYCLPLDAFAVSICRQGQPVELETEQKRFLRTIIFILIRRLTASMKTSNSSASSQQREFWIRRRNDVPKQRMGHPMDSQSDSSRHIVENDFSPPLRDRGSFSRTWV